MNCTHPIVAMLAGVPLAGNPCPCRSGLSGDNPLPDSANGIDWTPATGAGLLDWHYAAMAALAVLAAYALWPKPARELRNVRKREAAATYRKRLSDIGKQR